MCGCNGHWSVVVATLDGACGLAQLLLSVFQSQRRAEALRAIEAGKAVLDSDTVPFQQQGNLSLYNEVRRDLPASHVPPVVADLLTCVCTLVPRTP